MNSTLLKILAILLLVTGEALAIYAELIAARNIEVLKSPLMQVFLKTFLLIIIAGGFLIAGYMLGINVFKNIWVVSVASITAIIIVEPILVWLVFKQTPTIGAIIGFILGVVGLVVATLF